jgi:hypothetical protein
MNAPDKSLAPQMRKVSEVKGVRFDGKAYGYVPPKKLGDLAQAGRCTRGPTSTSTRSPTR